MGLLRRLGCSSWLSYLWAWKSFASLSYFEGELFDWLPAGLASPCFWAAFSSRFLGCLESMAFVGAFLT